jgi:hypothetical protein
MYYNLLIQKEAEENGSISFGSNKFYCFNFSHGLSLHLVWFLSKPWRIATCKIYQGIWTNARFLDLQKVEAQTREAQIEAALESAL